MEYRFQERFPVEWAIVDAILVKIDRMMNLMPVISQKDLTYFDSRAA